MINHKLITPEGTKDYIFDEVTARNNVNEELCRLFKASAYSQVFTPGLEYMDVFTGKGHGMPSQYMYKLVDSEGRLMVLRPDTTNPIARICSTRLKDEALPLRLFYSQSVFFSTRSMSGKSNEVLQAGVELVGNSGVRADLEVLALALRSLSTLSKANFRLEIGHIGIFNLLIEKLSINDETKEEIRLCIEAKNSPALNDLLDTMGDCKAVAALKQLPRLFGGEDVIQKASEIIDDKQIKEYLDYLSKLYNQLKELNVGGDIIVDLGVVSSTDYYTGVVFKGYIEGCYDEAVLSGGRYDNLMGSFSRETGAIGFAVNVDAVAKNTDVKRVKDIPDVLVYCNCGYEMEALTYCGQSDKGQVTEFSLCTNLDDALSYAKNKGIKKVVNVTDKIEVYRC